MIGFQYSSFGLRCPVASPNGSMGIAVRALTFGGRERALHAPYPQMWPLSKRLPRRFPETRPNKLTGFCSL